MQFTVVQAEETVNRNEIIHFTATQGQEGSKAERLVENGAYHLHLSDYHKSGRGCSDGN